MPPLPVAVLDPPVAVELEPPAPDVTPPLPEPPLAAPPAAEPPEPLPPTPAAEPPLPTCPPTALVAPPDAPPELGLEPPLPLFCGLLDVQETARIARAESVRVCEYWLRVIESPFGIRVERFVQAWLFDRCRNSKASTITFIDPSRRHFGSSIAPSACHFLVRALFDDSNAI
jgi:hypothetical protein